MTDSICILISQNITRRRILGSDCRTKYDKSSERESRVKEDLRLNDKIGELQTSLIQTNRQTDNQRLAFLELEPNKLTNGQTKIGIS